MDTAQIVRWAQLDTWAPPVSIATSSAWPVTRLGDILRAAKEPPARVEATDHVYLAGVRWYGNGVFIREHRRGDQLKGRIYPMREGRLIYNRLFAWKAAFAVVTADVAHAYVSNEFPQFEVEASTADLRFVQLLCVTKPFTDMVSARSTGTTAVSRNRLRESDLLDLAVPLPSLPEQRRLVAAHEGATAKALAKAEGAAALRASAWEDFAAELVVPSLAPIPVSASVSIARFSNLDRWDEASPVAAVIHRWPTSPLKAHADVRLGCQVPKRGGGTGPAWPYLRAANIRRGHLDERVEVKSMRVAQRQATALLLRRDDLLLVEGSGSPDEIGRCAIWTGDDASTIHQNSVIRARITSADLVPEFAMAWFNSEPGKVYFRQQATTTSGLYHLGSGKAERAPIPLPPRTVQERLASKLWRDVATADEWEGEADKLRRAADDDFTRAVFGSV